MVLKAESLMPKQVDPFKLMVRSAVKDVTPVRLRLLLVSNCLFSFLFCLVSISTILQHEHAVRVVGVDAAPSVMAVLQQIKIGVWNGWTALWQMSCCTRPRRKRNEPRWPKSTSSIEKTWAIESSQPPRTLPSVRKNKSL